MVIGDGDGTLPELNGVAAALALQSLTLVGCDKRR